MSTTLEDKDTQYDILLKRKVLTKTQNNDRDNDNESKKLFSDWAEDGVVTETQFIFIKEIVPTFIQIKSNPYI
ncbi:hypothetical protein V1478_005183 [Vespula squamosa]|uniref:Uncharacterized protein n=1 Tax=Vespula squamosa TaxID=30214 RepID=A0ABD2BDM8_VESSQ